MRMIRVPKWVGFVLVSSRIGVLKKLLNIFTNNWSFVINNVTSKCIIIKKKKKKKRQEFYNLSQLFTSLLLPHFYI